MQPFIEAEYESGYVHTDALQDISPYKPSKNIFNDILEKRPEPIHGKMVRFSLVLPEMPVPGEITKYDIDWTVQPANARPIRFKHMERDMVNGLWTGEARIVGIDFGFQYTNAEGKNIKEIRHI